MSSTEAIARKGAKSSKRRRDFTEEERAAYRERQRTETRERMEAAARELLTSDGWRRWAETRAKFHNYSLGNVLLIALQRPTASHVASFRRWQELGRSVRKGERAIRINAPMTVKTGEVDPATGEDAKRVIFKAVPVFDIAQTDGDPLPEPPCEPITGDSHEAFIAPLVAFAVSLGYPVRFLELDGSCGGYCRREPDAERHIAVEDTLPANGKVRVLVHEIAHALGVGAREYGRAAAECIVETAGYVVCAGMGLDTSGEAVPYVAGWGEADDVAALHEYAGTVDEIAAAIERAIGAREA